MSVLTYAQAMADAVAAGFRGAAASTIVAIAQAESGLNPGATNCNNPGGSCDRGILQINSYWHPEVSNAQAYDPVSAFQAAFRISSGGTNFKPWVTYQSGAYKQYMQSSPPAASPAPMSSTSSGSGSSSGTTDWGSYFTNIGFDILLFAVGVGILVGGIALVK